MAGQYDDAVLQAWVDAVRNNGVKNSMNKFVGDGVKTVYDINFAGGYLNKADILAYKVSPTNAKTDVVVTAVNDNKVTIDAPVETGWTLVIYRDTPKSFPIVDFADNSIINEKNLDTNFKQTVFGVAELLDRFDDTVTFTLDAYAAAERAKNSATAAEASEAAAAASAAAAATSAASALASANSASTNAAAVAADRVAVNSAAQQVAANTASAAASAGAAVQAADTAAGAAASAAASATSAASSAALTPNLGPQGIVLGDKVIIGFNATGLQNNAWVHFAGRDTVGDGGGGPFRYLAASTVTVDNGTVFAPTGGGRLVRQYTGDVNAAWYGVKPGIDVRLLLIGAMESAVALGKTLYLPAGVFDCGDWIYPPSALKMRCDPNSWLRLTSDTGPIGGFVIGGYDSALVKRPFADVEIHNLGLDCNNIAGENAFNAVMASNVRLFNPRIKNVLRSTTRLGGRAFQFEGGTIDGVYVYSPNLENCSIGLNSQGRPDGTEVVRNINYFDVVMRDVDVPFNIDSQFANPETNTPRTMSTTVYGAELYDCGRITWPGDTSSGLGGGIVCGDRGAGLTIFDLRVTNSAGYGGIGALTRGLLFDVSIHGAQIYAAMTAVYDFTTVGFGSAAASSAPARVQTTGVSVLGNLDYIVKGGPANNRIGACRLDAQIDSSVATIAGIVDEGAGTGSSGSSAYLSLSLKDQGFSESGLRSLANLYASSNNIGECQPNAAAGSWTPTDASGAGLTLTAIGTPRYERRGRHMTAIVGLSYPATTNTANAVLGGLPVVAANFSSMAGAVSVGYKTASALASGYVVGNTSTVILADGSGVPVTNAQLSGATIYLIITYLA